MRPRGLRLGRQQNLWLQTTSSTLVPDACVHAGAGADVCMCARTQRAFQPKETVVATEGNRGIRGITRECVGENPPHTHTCARTAGVSSSHTTQNSYLYRVVLSIASRGGRILPW